MRKLLSQKTIYKSKYFHVDQVEIEIKGKKIIKDIIRRNPSVFILALNEKNELYLVRQYRDALQQFSLEVIAGTTDIHEDPLMAAKRELLEESGLTAEKWKKLTTLNTSANMDSYANIFLAQNLKQGTAHPDIDEELEIVKISLQEAVTKVLNGDIVNSPSAAGILILDKIISGGEGINNL